MNLIFNLILVLFLKKVQADIRCPFPDCNTVYSWSNFCNVYCSKIPLTDRGTSRLTSIGLMKLDKISFIDTNVFSYLEISHLSFFNSLPQNIKLNAFKDLKRIIRLTFVSIPIEQFSIFQDNLANLRDKIETVSVFDSMNINQDQLIILLDVFNYLEIKNLHFANISRLSPILDLSNMTYLQSLVINSLKIEHFTVNLKQDLREFEIQNTNLNELTITVNSIGFILQDFFLSSNKIVKFKGKYLNANKILLHNNSFIYLGKENFILEQSNVSFLDLSLNKINFIEPFVLEKIRNVEFLSLSNNNLDKNAKFLNFSKILELDLSSNNYSIFTQEFIDGCDKIVKLDLSNNNIEFINISAKSLLKINLNQNRIKYLSDLKIPSVNELFLENNQLNSINDLDLKLFKKLTILNLNHNKIEFISQELLSSFKALQRFEIMDNYLENLFFPNLINLKILFLEKNKFEFVNRSHFGNLIGLEILTLCRNKIQHVHSDSFAENINLKKLDLSDNFLSDIPNVLVLPNLNYLNIYNQNGKLTEIKNYAFERNSQEIYLYLSFNNITYFSPHSFCLKNSSKTGSLIITLDNINFMHKCLLKQLDFGIQINLYYNKIDCYLQKFIDKYHYKVSSDFQPRVCPEKFVDDCSEEANLSFNCESNLNDFETTFSWLSLNDSIISYSDEFYKCFSINAGILFQYNDLKILLLENLDYSYMELMKNNKSINFKTVDNLKTKDFNSSLGYLKLDKHKHLFYYSKSDIYIVLGSFSKKFFDYVIVYTSKYIFNKADGYLAKKSEYTSSENSPKCNNFYQCERILKSKENLKSENLKNNQVSNHIETIKKTVNLLDEFKNDKSKKYSESNFDYLRRKSRLNGCSSTQIFKFFFYFNLLALSLIF